MRAYKPRVSWFIELVNEKQHKQRKKQQEQGKTNQQTKTRNPNATKPCKMQTNNRTQKNINYNNNLTM